MSTDNPHEGTTFKLWTVFADTHGCIVVKDLDHAVVIPPMFVAEFAEQVAAEFASIPTNTH